MHRMLTLHAKSLRDAQKQYDEGKMTTIHALTEVYTKRIVHHEDKSFGSGIKQAHEEMIVYYNQLLEEA